MPVRIHRSAKSVAACSRIAGCWAVAALTMVVAAEPASAIIFDRQILVNVVVVCDNAGANCASKGPSNDLFFFQETQKIWAQAGIGVGFHEAPTLNNTNFSNLDDSIPGKTTTDLVRPSSTTVNMYLVNTIAGAYGAGYQGDGGIAIAMDTVTAFNSGIGRIDTIAHELGHNLGLGHDDTNPNFLMASGATRNVPTSLGQICPSGPCFDLLSQDHIILARTSKLLQVVFTGPEPNSLSILALGLLSGGLARRWLNRVRR